MTQVWAHRGASAYRPENTLDAFELAVAMGADGIELDVHLSADGQVVVAHDETVDRVSDGTGRISGMELAALKALNFGVHFPQHGIARIPTLAEVFALMRTNDLTINVELKNSLQAYPGLEEKCISLAREMGLAERVIFSSFHHHSLLRVKALAPSFPCGLLYECTMVRPWEYAKALGMDALHPHFSELTVPDEVPGAHALGIRVHAWTLNHEDHLAFAAARGVDAMITNYPDRALRVLGREAKA